jgi:hypothetical protein
VSSPRPKDKPFKISKDLVWEAYQKIKANKGAPGVDEESIADFEKDLRNNLYKIWNRMSSGSYFPPPVKAVEILNLDVSPALCGVGGGSQGKPSRPGTMRADEVRRSKRKGSPCG